MKRLLSGFGSDVFQALRIGYAKEYLTKFKTGDIVICDFKLADGNVVELIEWLDYKNIGCNVFVITDVETVADAVSSFRAGAKDYINKRLIRELLIPKIKTLIGNDDDTNFPLLLSRKSDVCIKAYSAAHVVAPTNLNVMIIGESGVGKEPLAQEIYDESQRRDKPCVMMDCRTLHYLAMNSNTKQSPTLLDAVAAQFRKAQGGTVILDNIQHLSSDMQSIILHVIANSKHTPRIIATASTDISEMVIEGVFLSALFYKIKEFTINLPPLRECQDDIMLLADFYLRHYNQEFRKQVKRFDASAQREMHAHSWSGNIRELKHVVRVAVLKSRGELITSKELDFDTPTTGAHVQFKLKASDEKSKTTRANAHANGNLTKAANMLGLSNRTLWEKRKIRINVIYHQLFVSY